MPPVETAAQNRARTLNVLWLLAILISPTLDGCKRSMSMETNGSATQDAVVSSEQARKASEITAATREYIPYGYTPDGCYARAAYMQMKLADAGIPSNVAYVRTPVTQDRTTGDLSYAKNGPLLAPASWVYHVAPVITVDGKDVVIDPSLGLDEKKYPGGAMPKEEWLAMMDAKKYSPTELQAIKPEIVTDADGKEYVKNASVNYDSDKYPLGMPKDEWLEVMKAKDYTETDLESQTAFVGTKAMNTDAGQIFHENVNGQKITTVEEMTPFSHEGIKANYEVMDRYLLKLGAQNSLSAEEVAAKRATLATTTVELNSSLQMKSLIRSDAGDLENTNLSQSDLTVIAQNNDLIHKEELRQAAEAAANPSAAEAALQKDGVQDAATTQQLESPLGTDPDDLVAPDELDAVDDFPIEDNDPDPSSTPEPLEAEPENVPDALPQPEPAPETAVEAAG